MTLIENQIIIIRNKLQTSCSFLCAGATVVVELAFQTIEVNETDSSVEVCVIFTLSNFDELECNVTVSVLAATGAIAGTFYNGKLFRSPLHRFIEAAACAMALLCF